MQFATCSEFELKTFLASWCGGRFGRFLGNHLAAQDAVEFEVSCFTIKRILDKCVKGSV